MKILRDRILIKADKAPEKTQSGILMGAQEWKSVPLTGVVLGVGDTVTDVKTGDRVLFERYAAVMLEDDLRMCKEVHIHAIIDDDQMYFTARNK